MTAPTPISQAQPWTLYERTEMLAAILDQLEDPELAPEDRDALEDQLQAELVGARDKVDGIGRALATWEAHAQLASTEIERITRRRKAIESRSQRLKAYLLDIMERMGTQRMDGHTTTFVARRCAPSVHIWDVTQIPPEYLREADPPPPAPDKAAIRAAIAKQGIIVPGCSLVESWSLTRK